jgi:hypothetical protein
MPNLFCFIQECPTCGRRLQIRVEYLGRKMVCDHCHGRFLAKDPAGTPCLDPNDDLLRRADALLRSLDVHKTHRRASYS